MNAAARGVDGASERREQVGDPDRVAVIGRVAVLEQNAGQMIDDVRLALLGAVPVEAIGGISSDEAGFGVGDIYSPADVRRRVERSLAAQGGTR